MMLRMLTYFIKRAASSLREALLLNSLTVLTIVITMLILSSFLLVFHNVNELIGSKKAALELSVYLEDEIKQEQIGELSKHIRGNKSVKGLSYVSKDEALKRFLTWNKKLKPVLGKIGDNPFPASLEVILGGKELDARAIDDLAKEIESKAGVEKVNYSSDWAQKLSSFIGAMKGIGLFMLFFLSIATLFMVSNTIRLNIYARRDEIAIMRLVGATNSFIKIPFLIEGVFQGVLGSLGALLLLFLAYKTTYSAFEVSIGRLLGSSSYTFLSSDYMVFVIILGILVGFIGANFALRRFLRREV